MSKAATKEGTTRYAQKFAGRAAESHFREAHRLVLSSLGIGTYLGQPDEKTDAGYTAAAVAAVEKDRKSTRLNSSHRCISYAVFCLKKKKINITTYRIK